MTEYTQKESMPSRPSSYLALDIGTHAVKAALVQANGSVGEVIRLPITLQRKNDRCVEQCPDEILKALKLAVVTALAQSSEPITAAGLAIQRSTVMAWNKKTGKALSPALSWQDTRGHKYVDGLKGNRVQIEQISGLVLSPHYGASKIARLQASHGGSDVCISPLASFLVYHLLEVPITVCDESNAGRTQLWDLDGRKWSADLCSIFGVDANYLPRVKPVISDYGEIKHSWVQNQRILLTAVAGDQNAALMGVSSNSVKNSPIVVNLGSGAFILGVEDVAAPVPDGSVQMRPKVKPQGLLRSIAYSDKYTSVSVLEGTVNGSGLALSWLAQSPEVQEKGGEVWLLDYLHSLLDEPSCNTPSSGNYFYNSIGGLGSPFWRAGHESFFTQEDASIESKAVAIIESIVFLLAINIKLIARCKPLVSQIYVTGGMSRFSGLCQRLANITRCTIVRGAQQEATLLGVARMASIFSIQPNQKVDKVFEPQFDPQLIERFDVFSRMMKQDSYALVAHRGDAKNYPENSLLAIESAIRGGIKFIEFDIQLSLDGIPIVFHDDDLRRLAQVDGCVSEFTLEELKVLSVHEPERFEQAFFPARIPTLAEAVDVIKCYEDVCVFPEIKIEIFDHISREQALQKIWSTLKPIAKQCTVISRDLAVLRMLQQQSLCPVGWVLSHYNNSEYEQIKDEPVDVVICNYKHFPAKEEGLWSGPWDWFSYEITSQQMLDDCLDYGVKWIESRNAVGLLA